MAVEKCAPRLLGPDTDPDTASPGNRAGGQPMVLDVQSIGQKVQPVLREGDAHRPRQIAAPPAQLIVGKVRRPPLERTGTPAPHDRDAVPRIERAHEHGRGKAGDSVTTFIRQ